MAEDVKEPAESTADEQEPVEAEGSEQSQEAEEPQAEEGGQSAEDFKSALEEMRNELADLKLKSDQAAHEANYYKTLVFGQDKPPEEKQIASEPPTPDEPFDWQNPNASIGKVFRREFETWAKKRQESEEKQRKSDMARKYEYSFRTGASNALKTNPNLYKGIESEVSQYVQQMALQGQFQPEQLESPELWEKAGLMLRAYKGLPVDEFTRKTVKPVQNVSTERPGPQAPPKKKSQLTDAEREMIRGWGDVTEEQYLATKGQGD